MVALVQVMMVVMVAVELILNVVVELVLIAKRFKRWISTHIHMYIP